MRTLRRGTSGDDVRDVQSRLGALGYRVEPEEHGRYGTSTEAAVREFQQRRHLMVDGLVGPETWEELVEAGYGPGDRLLYLRYPYLRGDDVRAVQARLNLLGFDAGREDGIFGDRTDEAVREFQRNVGLPVDGIVGPTTLDPLERLRPVGPGPGRAAVREGEALRRLAASLRGSRIAVDAGHGPDDPGAVGPGGVREDEAAFAVAELLVAELERRGAAPFLVRTRDATPDGRERAAAANERGAEVLLSLHLNSHPDAEAEGASAYYYGSGQWVSPAGHRLAELILEELTSRLGLKDCRAHPKALQLLRETRMPAVQVEPCFVSNPREEALIGTPAFRAAVTAALADALELFYAGRDAGAPAGSSAPGAPGPGVEHREHAAEQEPQAGRAEHPEDLGASEPAHQEREAGAAGLVRTDPGPVPPDTGPPLIPEPGRGPTR